MKIQPVQVAPRRKMYVSYPASSSKNNLVSKIESEKADETAIQLPEFQRKLFIGNYFAGPHCLFDPRLIK